MNVAALEDQFQAVSPGALQPLTLVHLRALELVHFARLVVLEDDAVALEL